MTSHFICDDVSSYLYVGHDVHDLAWSMVTDGMDSNSSGHHSKTKSIIIILLTTTIISSVIISLIIKIIIISSSSSSSSCCSIVIIIVVMALSQLLSMIVLSVMSIQALVAESPTREEQDKSHSTCVQSRRWLGRCITVL